MSFSSLRCQKVVRTFCSDGHPVSLPSSVCRSLLSRVALTLVCTPGRNFAQFEKTWCYVPQPPSIDIDMPGFLADLEGSECCLIHTDNSVQEADIRRSVDARGSQCRSLRCRLVKAVAAVCLAAANHQPAYDTVCRLVHTITSDNDVMIRIAYY